VVLTQRYRLPRSWFELRIADGADCSRPGLYEWHIEGVGRYIGKFKRINRPLKEYGRNIVRLVSGLPYRKGKPDSFRRIHIELAQAVRSGRRIELTILENPPLADINRREQELIAERGSLNAGGRYGHKAAESLSDSA
jgi:hypothetical protein